MKNTTSLLYICLTISLINLFAILFYTQRKDRQTVAPFQYSTPHPSPETNVFVPENITLAGEKAPLRRWDVTEALRKELIVNTYLHSHTIQILRNAPQIFSIIEPILKQKGIPDDFKYLAVIESRLEPLAVSPAGAAGIWQFMKNTAQDFGLEINEEIDERYHIEKATTAAADYLKKAYEKFGSWTLAAASYNAGSTMLAKQIKLQQQTDYYNLLLGEETERYVFRILALKQIMNHPEKYHFSIPDPRPFENTREIQIKSKINNWADFAKEKGITYKTLKRFNPWLRKNQLRNPRHKTYKILLPKEKEQYQ